MALHTIEVRDIEDFAPRKAVFEYHAKNGQIFTKEAWYYEATETLSELSALAYENDTSMKFIVIH